MGSFVKFVGGAIILLLLLVVVAAVIFVVTFDPNDLKTAVVESVEEETGRELTIEGDIELSVFPYLGFSIGPTRLADAPGYGPEPFLAFDNAAASVRLLPLFTREIQIGELRLEGFALKAVTGEDGANNWDDLAKLAEAEAAADAGGGEGPGAGAGAGGFDPASLTIGSIVFRDARLSYEDRSQDARYAVTDWDLNSGAVQLGQPVDLETTLDLSATNPEFTGRVEARGRLTPGTAKTSLRDPELTVSLRGATLEELSSVDVRVRAQEFVFDADGPFSVAAPTIRVQAEGEALGEPLDARITAAVLEGDLQGETLSLADLEATAWGVTVTGELSGSQVMSSPRFSGRVAIAEFSPKQVAERAGAPLSPTVDPQALTRASLSGRFDSTPTSARFDDLVLKLDDTTLEGYLAVADFETQALRFELSADQLTLDRYMAPASEVPAAEAGGEDDVAIPAEDIRALNVDGRLEVQALSFGGLRSTNVAVTLKAADGTLRIHPSRADMYGGTYEGDISIDASGELPVLSMDERLQGVDFGALGEDVFDSTQLTGALDGRVTLTGTGATQSAIVSTLNGDLVFSFEDGAFVGVDIPYEMRRGLALIGKGAAPQGSSSGRTEFAELTGTAKVTDGVVRNDDLVVRLPFMQGTGEGTVDLTDESLRYELELQFQKSPELPDDASEFLGTTFPVVLSGTLSKPAIDVEGMAAALARERVEEEVDKVKERVLEQAGGALGDLLGGGKKKEDGSDDGEPDAEQQQDEDGIGSALRRLRKKIDE